MKHKISITVDEEVLFRVREELRSRNYRNKSHFFELAASQLLKGPLKKLGTSELHTGDAS